MARAYQEAHILDGLKDSVKSLQTQTNALTAAKGSLEQKVTTLHNTNEALKKKNEELETRMKAKYAPSSCLFRHRYASTYSPRCSTDDQSYSEHNAAARVSNSHIAQSADPNHAVLTPLHDVGTDKPVRQFPKHERDIKVMAQSQVIQILQALDIKTLGMGAADKKTELRAQIGLPRETSVTGA